MELRGTRKLLSDGINNPVRVMGFSSLEFATTLSLISLIGILIFFIGGVLICLVVVLPSLWAFVLISKKLKASQEKGIDKPFIVMLQWGAVPKRIRQTKDIFEIYASKRSN